jgi:hypothetical protein
VVVAETPQPVAATADTGAVIAADSLDLLAIDSTPEGDHWEFRTSGGTATIQQSPDENGRCLRLLSEGRSAARVVAKRTFPGQEHHAGFECRLRMGQPADGYTLEILSDDQPVATLSTRKGALGCENSNTAWRALQPYSANVWYTIRIAIDMSGNTFDVYIDGVRCGEKIKLRRPVQSVGAWQAATPIKAAGQLYLTAMKVTER